MTVDLVGDAVAEMGERFGAGLDAGLKFRSRFRHLVPKRHGNAVLRKPFDELRHAGNLGGDIDHLDQAFGCILKTAEKLLRRLRHPFGSVGADGARLGRDERPLKKEPEDVALADGVFFARRHYRAYRFDEEFRIKRHERRQIPGGSVALEALGNLLYRLNGQSRRVEIDPAVPVYLKINPTAVHCSSFLCE